MKKVLMVAYQFPPAGGSGVQRSAKFAKYLPAFGWEPVVLTRSDKRIGLRDDTLLQDLPADMEIIRTPPRDLTAFPGILSKVGKFIAWKVLIPDGEILWMKRAVKEALARIGRGDIHCLYTTSYPYSDHLMGLGIKRIYPELPWIADFRDEWTNNPYLLDKPHPAWRARRESLMERMVLETADMLIANTPVMKRNFESRHPDLKLDRRMWVIPNGFDEEDFEQSGAESPDNRFTVTYTGSLYGRRTPDGFLEAAGRLVKTGRIPRERLRIRFIGNIKDQSVIQAAARNGLEGVVEVLPYMTHRDCIGNMLRSHVLLLLEGGRGSECFYTGKLFEYIRTNRPILALVPEKGAAAELIQKTRTGIVCDWSNPRAIEQGLAELYDRWREDRLWLDPDHEVIRQYSRRALTEKLAGIMDGMAGMKLP
ncbi:MAG TPA: glycosyltransferase [Thermoclostridium caenicola]|uniref:glycosyltransferase n=1 Tax=Thermoclostridium caenicola TaxID=659425 RepID=UPI002CBDFB5F|nr:glycosyltransferase [Thermoclostridium caenicola]HOK42465.1 glycosyltransferase [Thermoclostridium caenicola]HOL85181.1 glycosyltransferase [Thermoclostridium caenicola]HPO76723.1 glycosyltransferase [Thermoclostridium caenicola]